MKQFVDALLAGLTVGLSALLAALVSLAVIWLRLQRAKLRAERQKLPPSTDPPPPSEPWYSLRPRRQRKRRR